MEIPQTCATSRRMNVVYDMETQDPDDFFALCILASHPAVQLRAVSVMPGSPHQIGMIKHTLQLLGCKDIQVGGWRKDERDQRAVSGFHQKLLGDIPPVEPDGPGWQILERAFQTFPDCVLITGAPLHNLGELMKNSPCKITRWVAQGGFAGDSVVPEAYRLPKFAGMETCQTFNFGGSKEAALSMLSSDRIAKRDLVSKNVCHGVAYDRTLHERIRPIQDNYPGLALIFKGMEQYLAKKNDGKLFHDPLAVCAAIDPSIIEWREVEMYTEKGKWGARLKSATNTRISVHYNHEAFFQVLIGKRPPLENT